MTDWISIEERLPEQEKQVLVVVVLQPASLVGVVRGITTGRYGLDYAGRLRWFVNGGWTAPTHWMPLPELPR